MPDLTFTPQTDDFIEDLIRQEEEERLVECGEAIFEVVAARSMMSHAGNPMIKVSLMVWDRNNKKGFIDDFLMCGEKSFFINRIKSFCKSIGIMDIYNSGKLNASDINNTHCGKIIIGTRKDKNGKLQNSVMEYLEKQQDQNMEQKFLNDVLPNW